MTVFCRRDSAWLYQIAQIPFEYLLQTDNDETVLYRQHSGWFIDTNLVFVFLLCCVSLDAASGVGHVCSCLCICLAAVLRTDQVSQCVTFMQIICVCARASTFIAVHVLCYVIVIIRIVAYRLSRPVAHGRSQDFFQGKAYIFPSRHLSLPFISLHYPSLFLRGPLPRSS